MRLRLLLSGLLAALLLLGARAEAQQPAVPGQDFFIPGQQRPPAQATPPAQRPPAQATPGQQQRPAAGQRPPAPVVVIVDIPEVQRLSAAFSQLREELERRRVRLNDELQREQARWREEQQALAGARATLPPETLRLRERDLQDRITDAQRAFRDRNRAIDAAAQQGLQQFEQALGAVIRQVSSSRGANLVLPKQLTVFNDPVFEITDEVSAQLNRVLRTVNLPPEGVIPGDPPAAATPAPAAPAQPAPAQPAQPRR